MINNMLYSHYLFTEKILWERTCGQLSANSQIMSKLRFRKKEGGAESEG